MVKVPSLINFPGPPSNGPGPTPLVSFGAKIITPFFADVVTRSGGTVTYDNTNTLTNQGTANGILSSFTISSVTNVFLASWPGVGYYSGTC